MEYLLTSFSKSPDFRINRKKLYGLTEIIFISICATICGCDDYVSIKSWADDNLVWLRQYIVLPNALNCQKAIAEKIVEKQADYIWAVKGNQPTLEAQIIQSFQLEEPASEHITYDKDHGRIEKRTCQVITKLDWIGQKEAWKDLTSLVKVVSERTIISENKTTIDTRYFICNQAFQAGKMLAAIRSPLGNRKRATLVIGRSF
jgi:predicted transposase YbfD/YdcC